VSRGVDLLETFRVIGFLLLLVEVFLEGATFQDLFVHYEKDWLVVISFLTINCLILVFVASCLEMDPFLLKL